MPTRNQAAYLDRAVESVFTQGIAGLRLYVQDGASTDGTPARLAALQQRYPALRWRSENDRGPADALNRAFAWALADTDAPVLGWLNSDDLYTTGAAARALSHLAAHPGLALVYGEAQHIDAEGQVIGPYPTHAPDMPLHAWADGCPICQPTVFMRRALIQALSAPGEGPLDTTLKTAFDYELWLKVLARGHGKMGHLAAVQAQSRLHEAGLTLSQRETVAMEGLQVVARHLGTAPPHWLLTYANELLQQLPDLGAEPPLPRLLALADRARPWLGDLNHGALRQRLGAHAGLRAASPGVHPLPFEDGWAPASMPVRLRRPPQAGPALLLRGRHESPGELHLSARALDWPSGAVQAGSDPPATPCLASTVVHDRGPFEWRIALPALPPAGGMTLWIERSPAFVPARDEAGSHDTRPLGFVLDTLAWDAEVA